MSADEDTELRDLVAQTLESNGVLGKIRAQLRASVFLALEEQESLQNKTPFQNQDLKKYISTKEGRLVTGLVKEFLEFFNLEFTSAVFEPETGFNEHYEGRESLCRECSLAGSSGSSVPLLSEVLRRGSTERVGRPKLNSSDDLSSKQIAEARRRFEQYDSDRQGFLEKDELKSLFCDMFPKFSRNMLDRFVNDEVKASDNAVDFEEFLAVYRRLFTSCKSVVSQEGSDATHSSPRKVSDSGSRIPAPVKKNTVNGTVEAKNKRNLENGSVSSRSRSSSQDEPMSPAKHSYSNSLEINRSQGKINANGLDDISGSDTEEDPFFDDPLPALDKAKTFTNSKTRANQAEVSSSPARSGSHIPVPKSGGSDRSKSAIPKATSNQQPSSSGSGLTSLSSLPPLAEKNASKDASNSHKSETSGKSQSELKEIDKRMADLGFDIDVPEDDYDDDFQSDGLTHSARTLSSARSEKSVTRTASVGEEIEEVLDEELEDIEEDISAADDFLKDSQSGFDDLTTDRTISPRQAGSCDYMEDILGP